MGEKLRNGAMQSKVVVEEVSEDEASVVSVREQEKEEEEALVEVQKTLIQEEDDAIQEIYMPAVKAPKEPSSPSSTFGKEAEQAGEGDIAVAIGNALDMAANAIDAVVNEVDKPVAATDSRTILDSVDPTINDNASAPSVAIVSTPSSDESVSASSHNLSTASSTDEWQVLDKDGDQVSSDEMIAQAAQLLGSALFQSDTISDVTPRSNEPSRSVSSSP